MQPILRYDPIKDFAPISTLANALVVVIVAASLPPRNLRELVQLAKSQPGALKFGSAGTGHFVHIAGEMFKASAAVDLLHVPYKGVAQALVDLLAGRIDVMFDAFAQYQPHLQSGKLRALAVANPTRLSRLPDVPTTAEAGLPDYMPASWFGLAEQVVVEQHRRMRVRRLLRDGGAVGDADRGADHEPVDRRALFLRLLDAVLIDRQGERYFPGGDQVREQRMAAAHRDAVRGDELPPELDALVLSHVGNHGGEPLVVVAFDRELAFPLGREEVFPPARQLLLLHLVG